MMSFIRPRLRKPAWTVLAGAVFAAAWVIRGGPHWWLWVSLIAIAGVRLLGVGRGRRRRGGAGRLPRR
jgi:fatty acid desaturase